MKLLLSLCIILSTIHLHAQNLANPPNKEFAYNHNYWFVYSGTHVITDKWEIYTEFQYRQSEAIDLPFQIQLRSTLDYKLNDKVTASIAYVWTETHPYGNQRSSPYTFGEHRPFEQIVINNRVGRLYLTHRYRLEQRFSESKSYDASLDNYFFHEWVYKNRFRYRMMFNIPLNHKEMVDKTIFFSFYDELFISFGKNVKKNMFDQNRISAGLGYRFNKHFNITAGYLLQSVLKSDGFKLEQNHTIYTGITYNLDFRKRDITPNP